MLYLEGSTMTIDTDLLRRLSPDSVTHGSGSSGKVHTWVGALTGELLTR